ncbi:hypothetical protein ACFQ1S_04965 [Kibdelosporangium lantanae]|uniref:Uncharacterized protein n=1 Tax=Kibdelosporangium lantanae TaxID=1497396 RepID=A0ABW3M4Y8_9PSEU
MASDLAEGDNCELPATAECWLADDPQPGMVLVEFNDAHGRPHQLVGKCAWFDGDLLPTSTYPCPTVVPCRIEEVENGVATVSTRWMTGGPDDVRFVFDVPYGVLRPVED